MKSADARLRLLVASILLLCGICGGSSFILIKSLVTQVTPLQLVAGRVVLAAVVLAAGTLVTHRLPSVDRPLLQQASVLAVIDVIVPYTLIAVAASHVFASTSALLVSTMPLFTAVFVSFADRTRLAAITLTGLGIGAAGVTVVAGPSALDLSTSDTLAMFAVVVSAASFAAAAVYSRVPLRTTDPVALSAVKFLIASVVVVPAVAYHQGVASFVHLDTAGWLSLLGLGVITTALARCGYLWVIREAGSVTASLLTYVTPAAALLLGFALMDETVSWPQGAGIALIAASLTCVLFGNVLSTAAERVRVRLLPRTKPRLAALEGLDLGEAGSSTIVP